MLICVKDHWETYRPQPKSNFGPEYEFAKLWARDHPNEKIGILKYSVLGSAMEQWAPGSLLNNNLWLQYFGAGHIPVQAFFWMQGEADADNPVERSNQYPKRLNSFVKNMRSILGDVPFVIGKTSWPGPYLPRIQAAQKELERNLPGVYLIETADLPLRQDHIHITEAGQTEFGRRMYTTLYHIPPRTN